MPARFRLRRPFPAVGGAVGVVVAVAVLVAACGTRAAPQWADLAMPPPPGPDGQGRPAAARGVSCGADGFCVVTGLQVPGGLPFASAWNGSRWEPLRVSGLRASCVSARFCAMVSAGGIATWDGGAWHTSAPEDAFGPVGTGFADVACAPPGWCLALGSERAATWDGRRWRDVGPGPADAGRLSCADPSFCLAVPTSGNARVVPLARWGGDGWRTVEADVGGDDWRLNDLSCWAVDRCVLAGYRLARPAGVHLPVLRRWDGERLVPVADQQGGEVASVSCAPRAGTDDGTCLALGPVPAVGGDGDWRTYPAVSTPAGAAGVNVAAVSCTVEWCLAVGDAHQPGAVTPLAARVALPATR